MNPHLNIFNNYREDSQHPVENNLTRAFIIMLRHEPNLLRDFLYLVNNEQSWDEITVSIQDKNIDISGFEKVIGLALTSRDIPQTVIDEISSSGSETPIPDFLVYNQKTLIVGEVKKHSENPIAQLKNQLNYLVENRSNKAEPVTVEFQAFSWTAILSKLVIPYINFNHHNKIRTIWASEFKDYVATHYSDWLPVPTLDKIDFTIEEDSVTRQLIEKRLSSIQSLTKFGPPQYWVGGRSTMPINFGWATEAQVLLARHKNEDYIQIYIWPADTKSQGYQIFYKDMSWINQAVVNTKFGAFELVVNPYIKFSHVMGKWIGAINFYHDFNALGKAFHTRSNFERFCHSWDREDWPELKGMLDQEFSKEFEWRDDVEWDAKFEHSKRNFVFISMGFECCIFIPFKLFQESEKKDSSGKLAADLLEVTIENFRTLINSSKNK
ncbi:MAG: hypothetical protein JWP78_2313 [Mucilaginibacter sp.]|nr:hypothetical protein [Mucilaginibacter sp.]